MNLLKILSILLLMLLSIQLDAQSFFGYQTIGVHTVYCAISWQNEQPRLGFGYTRRVRGGNQFTDLQAEWHFPLAEMYSLQNHQLIAGVYFANPSQSARRLSSNIGAHIRLTRQTQDNQHSMRVGLAASYLPSYTFAASLNNGLYGVVGLRGTYEAVLFAKSWTPDTKASANWKGLPIHHVEVGGNINAHLERTLGLSVNGFQRKYFAKDASLLMKGEGEWQTEGNLYFGTTYFLRRN